MTHQGDGRAPVALVFVSCASLLALVGPLLVTFQPIKHVESAAVPIGARDHLDWLFNFVNQRKQVRSLFSSSSHLIIPIQECLQNDMATWNEETETVWGEQEWCENG